ncbi:hypothetical protein BaRGS_00040103 [Batillaria attramentaria]|uniref:Uncharacterized protein n=1 Tax=Batillaria attramentaria TaxID=370345 RepID=A0ABD0J1Z0_9CAEN
MSAENGRQIPTSSVSSEETKTSRRPDQTSVIVSTLFLLLEEAILTYLATDGLGNVLRKLGHTLKYLLS